MPKLRPSLGRAYGELLGGCARAVAAGAAELRQAEPRGRCRVCKGEADHALHPDGVCGFGVRELHLTLAAPVWCMRCRPWRPGAVPPVIVRAGWHGVPAEDMTLGLLGDGDVVAEAWCTAHGGHRQHWLVGRDPSVGALRWSLRQAAPAYGAALVGVEELVMRSEPGELDFAGVGGWLTGRGGVRLEHPHSHEIGAGWMCEVEARRRHWAETYGNAKGGPWHPWGSRAAAAIGRYEAKHVGKDLGASGRGKAPDLRVYCQRRSSRRKRGELALLL